MRSAGQAQFGIGFAIDVEHFDAQLDVHAGLRRDGFAQHLEQAAGQLLFHFWRAATEYRQAHMGEGPLTWRSTHPVLFEGLGPALDVGLVGELATADQAVVQAQQQHIDIQIAQVFAVFQVQVRHGAGSRHGEGCDSLPQSPTCAKAAILKGQDLTDNPDRGEEMPVPHDLLADLHVTADAFQALIDKDQTLHSLHKEYNAKDKEVLAAEGNGTNDEAVNRLRKERLLIKDKIERIIHPPKA